MELYSSFKSDQNCNNAVHTTYLPTWLTDWLTTWTAFLKNLIRIQLVKKFPTLHGTQWFIIMFTSQPPILSQMNPIHTFPFNFPNVHSNIFPSMLRSSKWSLPFRFSLPKFCMHLSPIQFSFTWSPPCSQTPSIYILPL